MIAESPLPYERIHPYTNKWRPVFLLDKSVRNTESGSVMKDLLEQWSLAVFSLSGRYLSLLQEMSKISAKKGWESEAEEAQDTLKSLGMNADAADSETPYTSLFTWKIH